MVRICFWFGFLCYNEGMNGATRTGGRDSFVAALTALGLVAAGLVWAASALDYKWQWGRAMSFAFKMSEDGVVWGPLAKGRCRHPATCFGFRRARRFRRNAGGGGGDVADGFAAVAFAGLY